MNTISCPHCKKKFELSEALVHELEETLLQKEREKQRKDIIQMKNEIEEQTRKKALSEFQSRIDTMTKEKEEERIRNMKLIKQLEQLNDEMRNLRRKDEERDLQMKKEMLQKESEIKDEIKRKSNEEYRLKEIENEKKLQDALRVNEELRRKLEQGSQQLQGEVQELDLENVLKRTFPNDTIEPIGKGVLGADIRHIVRSPMGIDCGRILWESKRTKQWSDGWISKLKQDLLSDKSHIPAIISEILPEEAKSGIGFKEGVWIANPKFILPLALLLRSRLLDVAKQKKISENRDSKSEMLYGYVTSVDFQHQMESMIETYLSMNDQIQTERRAYERMWKQREQSIQKLITSVSGVYGSLQGVLGSALPTIKGLDLSEGEIENLKLIE
jgi:hypothetical protein